MMFLPVSFTLFLCWRQMRSFTGNHRPVGARLFFSDLLPFFARDDQFSNLKALISLAKTFLFA